jgi:hypothetical protein
MAVPVVTFANATSTANAATANGGAGVITTEVLSTATSSGYTMTLTNSMIAAADIVTVDVSNGTNTQGFPTVTSVTPAAGSVVIIVANAHVTQAISGTLKINWQVLKAATSPRPILS